MRQVEIAGSYYELGLNYGRFVVENNLNCWWKQPTESALALVKECERGIAVHAPGLLEEIRGIADACIADKEGRIARVEAAPEGVDVALTQDGMLAANTNWVS
jgi:hypothetical protein